jgi:hypothetical protein
MPKNKTKRTASVFWARIISLFLKPLRYIRSRLNRQTFAYIFMFSFILLTSIGAGLFNPALGFVVAGIACGIFGFLLGVE